MVWHFALNILNQQVVWGCNSTCIKQIMLSFLLNDHPSPSYSASLWHECMFLRNNLGHLQFAQIPQNYASPNWINYTPSQKFIANLSFWNKFGMNSKFRKVRCGSPFGWYRPADASVTQCCSVWITYPQKRRKLSEAWHKKLFVSVIK